MYDLLPAFLQRLIWVPIRLLYRHFLDFKIIGLEHLQGLSSEDSGVIFASNHAWEIDPTFIPAALPFFAKFLPMHYVSLTKEHYDHLPGWRTISGGTLFKAWGAYPAILGVKNFDISLAHHIKFLLDGKSLCIFPEGGICRGGEIKEARPGVSYLALRTGSAIVPVHIIQSGPLRWHDFIHKRLKVTIIFGQPCTLATFTAKKNDYSIEDHKLIAASIMQRVYALGSQHEA